jgi:hypothetical protein
VVAHEIAADTASVGFNDPGGSLLGGGGHANHRTARGKVGRGAVRARAGDLRGLLMVKSTIGGVVPLHLVGGRKRLVLLAAVVESRPGSDHRDLTRMARQVAALRPV